MINTYVAYYRAKALNVKYCQVPSAKADGNLLHNFTVCFTDCVKIVFPNLSETYSLAVLVDFQ